MDTPNRVVTPDVEELRQAAAWRPRRRRRAGPGRLRGLGAAASRRGPSRHGRVGLRPGARDPGGPAGRLAAPGRSPDQRHRHGHRRRRPGVERLLAAGPDRPHGHPDVDLRLSGKAAREASAEATQELASVGVEGTESLERIRLRRTHLDEAEDRLAAARADRDAAYARFEDLAPGRLPSEIEEIIADHEAEQAEATVRAEAEAAARKAEAEARPRPKPKQQPGRSRSRSGRQHRSLAGGGGAARTRSGAGQGTGRAALSRGPAGPGPHRGAAGRARPRRAGQAFAGMARGAIGVQWQWGRAGPPAERLGRFGAPRSRFRRRRRSGAPTGARRCCRRSTSTTRRPGRTRGTPAEPGVERVRGVVEGADAAGLTDRLLQLGQPPGTAGRETTGWLISRAWSAMVGCGRLHGLLRRAGACDMPGVRGVPRSHFPIGTYASSA